MNVEEVNREVTSIIKRARDEDGLLSTPDTHYLTGTILKHPRMASYSNVAPLSDSTFLSNKVSEGEDIENANYNILDVQFLPSQDEFVMPNEIDGKKIYE